MTWGTGPWGGDTVPWGTGSDTPPPAVIGVTSEPGPGVPAANPAVINVLGGTILRIVGSNFYDPVTVELLSGSGGSYVVAGAAYVFDPAFDVTAKLIYAGSPRLDIGTYSLRVSTPAGVSAIAVNVIEARVFADEYKTVSVRSKFGTPWATGSRELRK